MLPAVCPDRRMGVYATALWANDEFGMDTLVTTFLWGVPAGGAAFEDFNTLMACSMLPMNLMVHSPRIKCLHDVPYKSIQIIRLMFLRSQTKTPPGRAASGPLGP